MNTGLVESYNGGFANLTVLCTGISALWCPSDPGIQGIDLSGTNNPYGAYGYTNGYFYFGVKPLPPGSWAAKFTNYSACYGTSGAVSNWAGIYCTSGGYQATKISQVTDGLSNTLAFADATVNWLPASFTTSNYLYNPFWCANADTDFLTRYPPNPKRYVSVSMVSATKVVALASAASLHPGGANCASATAPFTSSGRRSIVGRSFPTLCLGLLFMPSRRARPREFGRLSGRWLGARSSAATPINTRR